MYKELTDEENLEVAKMMARLSDLYPTARPRLIGVMFECIELHARKNNDYNGNLDLYRATGVRGRFDDIWRKIIRMFNAVVLKTIMVVDENLIETGKDSMVYHGLFIEELEEDMRKQDGGSK